MQPQDPNQSPYPENKPPIPGDYPSNAPGQTAAQQDQQNAPQVQDPNQPQQMYYQRPLQPQAPVMTEEVKRRHEECLQKYPKLNLSSGEYVISDVRRHPIGLLSIWAIVGVTVAVILTLLVLVMTSSGDNTTIPPMIMGITALLLCSLALLFGYVGTYVYQANQFFLTNESVIQVIQSSVFSRREQTVSLSNIEDASFTKHGIIQHMFDYGQIRLSTEGDETTYRFPYAANPSKQVAVLNNAVEAFKNGRPVVE